MKLSRSSIPRKYEDCASCVSLLPSCRQATWTVADRMAKRHGGAVLFYSNLNLMGSVNFTFTALPSSMPGDHLGMAFTTRMASVPRSA